MERYRYRVRYRVKYSPQRATRPRTVKHGRARKTPFSRVPFHLLHISLRSSSLSVVPLPNYRARATAERWCLPPSPVARRRHAKQGAATSARGERRGQRNHAAARRQRRGRSISPRRKAVDREPRRRPKPGPDEAEASADDPGSGGLRRSRDPDAPNWRKRSPPPDPVAWELGEERKEPDLLR